MPLRRCLDANHEGCLGWAKAPDSLCRPCRRRRQARRDADHALAAQAATADRCAICGQPPRPGDPLTLDHRVPVSAGGSSLPGNVRAAHRSCNSRKRDR